LIIAYTTILAFASLYLPQPILPLLALQFDVSETDAALLTAVTMVPLGLAPVLYGHLVDRISAKRLLRVAIGCLMLTEIGLAMAPAFWIMIGLRFLQGLVLPAVITALMTYSASAARTGGVRRAMNVYIGTSIIGGVSGRLVGGFVSEYLHWRAAFALVAGLLLIAWWMLGSLREGPEREVDHIGSAAIVRTLKEPLYRNAYLGIFCVFFVFASLLNYLPFRLKSLEPGIMESTISLVYLGYLIGVAIALNGTRIADAIGGEIRGMFVGVVILTAGVAGMTSTNVPTVFALVFCLCAGFFMIHSLLTAYLNHVTEGRRGVVNGLYIGSYYTGGALGGWLPGYVYGIAGWNVYLVFLATILVLAAGWIACMGRAASRIAGTATARR
jgi:YNFM family putative membrane transporter